MHSKRSCIDLSIPLFLSQDPDDSDDEDEDHAPLLPTRNYDSSEVEGDVAPPLPPRNFNYSDIEDNDEEVISDGEQDIQEISTTDQVALYASVCEKVGVARWVWL